MNFYWCSFSVLILIFLIFPISQDVFRYLFLLVFRARLEGPFWGDVDSINLKYFIAAHVQFDLFKDFQAIEGLAWYELFELGKEHARGVGVEAVFFCEGDELMEACFYLYLFCLFFIEAGEIWTDPYFDLRVHIKGDHLLKDGKGTIEVE